MKPGLSVFNEDSVVNMKFSLDQIQNIREKVRIGPIPEDSKLLPGLRQTYGNHTFYADPHGLNIWKTIDFEGTNGLQVRAVRVASWDETKTGLKPHTPVPRVIVAL